MRGTNIDETTASHQAVCTFDASAVLALLQDGKGINVLDRFGISPVIQAAIEYNKAAFQEIIHQSPGCRPEHAGSIRRNAAASRRMGKTYRCSGIHSL